VVLIPWQHHDDIYVCTPGLAKSDGDGMDSILECIVSGMCYASSRQPLKTDATRGPKQVVLIRSEEPPGMFDWRPGSLPRVAG
jgi:hypothetical protein